MGQDWLREIWLDWRTVAKVTATSHPPGPLADKVAALQDRYAEVFEEMLGTITPFFATLSDGGPSSVSHGLSPLHFGKKYKWSLIV